MSDLYAITLYYRKDLSDQRNLSNDITTVEIADYDEAMLDKLGLFDSDIVVCSTNDDDINFNVATMAKNMVSIVWFVVLKQEEKENLTCVKRHRNLQQFLK